MTIVNPRTVKQHFQDGHGPDFDNASILMMEPNEFKKRIRTIQLILESTWIISIKSITAFWMWNFRIDVQNSVFVFSAFSSGSKVFFDKVFLHFFFVFVLWYAFDLSYLISFSIQILLWEVILIRRDFSSLKICWNASFFFYRILWGSV